jgi:hypothetical protein
MSRGGPGDSNKRAREFEQRNVDEIVEVERNRARHAHAIRITEAAEQRRREAAEAERRRRTEEAERRRREAAEAERRRIEEAANQETNIIKSLINLGSFKGISRQQLVNYEQGSGIYGTDHFMNLKADIKSKLKYSGLNIELKDTFLDWSSTTSNRNQFCYICGCKLLANPNPRDNKYDTQNDHVIEYVLSAGLMGHGSRNAIRPVHKMCNSPIKANPQSYGVSGAPANSGLLGWGILKPPYIDSDGGIHYWHLNRTQADLLRTTAQGEIIRSGIPGGVAIENLYVRSHISTYQSVIAELNNTHSYGSGGSETKNPSRLLVLKNSTFRSNFLTNDQLFGELTGLPGVKLIDKFLYGLIVTACMNLMPDSHILQTIFENQTFKRAVENVLGPKYYKPQGSGGRSGGAGPSGSRSHFGKRKQKPRLKSLKQLVSDLKSLKKF